MPPLPIIRPAVAADLPLLPAIEDAAAARFIGTGASLDASIPNVTAAAFAAGLARGSLWVAADDDGRAVGFLLAQPRPPWLHLCELDVVPDHGGRGLGRGLIAAAAAAAAGLGCDRLSLTTYRDIAWNAPFYRRLGFVDLPPADQPDWLAAILANEIAHGLDPASRCVMVRPL